MSDVANINDVNKTHYRKAFKSPYLSSADIVKPTELTVAYVTLEGDRTKKTKDQFNTAHFAEKELRPGETLKPMILNAHNSKVMKGLTGSHFIDDWRNVRVTIYVDDKVRFGRDMVEGLRISPNPVAQKMIINKDSPIEIWDRAKAAYKRDGNFLAVLEHADMTEETMEAIMKEVARDEV